MDQNSNFSGIPSLGDVKGLENFLNSETLASLGIQSQPAAQPATDPNAGQQPAAQPTPVTQPATQGAQNPTPTSAAPQVTTEQINAIFQNLDAINKRLSASQVQQPQVQQPAAQMTPTGYTQQELNFINAALAKGYSLDQINRTIMANRNPATSGLEQRIKSVEDTLKSQEYKQAETQFIEKLSAFGEKWGLSEQDLVTFGTVAYQKGINIAMPNVDLEAVFNAVYPQQYAIRAKRMSPTQTSQIYGGNSIPEGNRQMAEKAEDAYVEAFLKQAMPNYGKK